MEVILTDTALADIDDLLAYIQSGFGDKASDRFFQAVKLKVTQLKRFPQLGKPILGKPYRKLLVNQKTWLLYWLDGNRILITHLYDARTNPENWRLD